MTADKLDSKEKVLIIGGGPSGLTAAYQCGKKNMPAVCFEADSILGGISRTVKYKGYRFDVGGHRFFSKIPAVNKHIRHNHSPIFLLTKSKSNFSSLSGIPVVILTIIAKYFLNPIVAPSGVCDGSILPQCVG